MRMVTFWVNPAKIRENEGTRSRFLGIERFEDANFLGGKSVINGRNWTKISEKKMGVAEREIFGQELARRMRRLVKEEHGLVN